MGKSLVIVESPAKAKTINKILGKDFVVRASMGHVRDLPERKLGVDIENYRPERMSVLPKVLRPEELAAIEALPEQDRWLAALLRFSIKESIYKAIDPYVRRYVGFQEALVVPDLEGRAMVTMFLERDEGPFAIDARYLWLEGRLLTSVRIRPQQPPD